MRAQLALREIDLPSAGLKHEWFDLPQEESPAERGIPYFPTPSAAIPPDTVNLKTWQFAFNRLSDLPEILAQGHEREYLTWIFGTKSTRSYAIEPAAIEEYTRQYSAPGAMRAGFEWYRENFGAEGLA